MTTDPKEFPGADPHTGSRDIDPVTGYDTTGHEWGGIKELNTPFPRFVLWFLVATVVYSVIAWVLLPAWPYGPDYTRGLLGLDQREMATEGVQSVADIRADWLSRFGDPDYTALQDDGALMARAMPAADRLYNDNCAVCHGDEGGGGPGFPVLNDTHWLWGGDPATIATTLQVGINAQHPDTRIAQMPAFGWMERSQLRDIASYVAALPEGDAVDDRAGATLFAENCTACHGEGGVGGMMNGAPALTDDAVIYGQSPASVIHTVRNGRQGVMPHWSDRLRDAEINLLALYVSRLPEADDGGDE